MLLITFSATDDRCVYCGNYGDTRDHFIPLKFEHPGDVNFEVPCCTKCNALAGTRRYASFPEKIRSISAMARRYINSYALRQIAPLVMESYTRFKSGEPLKLTLGLCCVCGTEINAERLKHYAWQKVPLDEQTCRTQHTKLRQYDKNQRANHTYKQTGASLNDLIIDIGQKPLTVNDLWRQD
jgi:hypothetical protein